jgi:hypothetical protein
MMCHHEDLHRIPGERAELVHSLVNGVIRRYAPLWLDPTVFMKQIFSVALGVLCVSA